MKYYFIALIERILKEISGVISAIAQGSQGSPSYVNTVQEYTDTFLSTQLQLNTTSAEVAQYVSTSHFTNYVAKNAPTVHELMKGSVAKGIERLTDTQYLTAVVQEVQHLIQSSLGTSSSNLGLDSFFDLKGYAPMIAAPIFGMFFPLGANLILPFFVTFLDIIFQIIVFGIVLSGLLSQSESPLTPVRRLLRKLGGSSIANFESRLVSRIEDQISGICLFTAQMGVFHSLFSWLTLHLARAPGPCIFGALSGLIAIIPVGGPYLGTLLPAMIMWHGEGRYGASLGLFITNIIVAIMVDSHFYNHLPTVSVFFVALAAFLGHAALGLQGILIGPLVLSMVPVLYSEFIVDPTEEVPDA